MINKRASLMHKILVQIILVAVIFTLFFFTVAEKVNSRGLRQQIIEKQTALLIDSAIPGMSFEISKLYLYGYVEDVKIIDGRIHIAINGLASIKGYPIFTPYSVFILEEEDKFVVNINE